MNRYEQLQEELTHNQYTWLVTGAAGFIGSNLVEKLLTLNQKVIGLDNFETGYQHNLDQAVEDAITQHPPLERGRDGVGVRQHWQMERCPFISISSELYKPPALKYCE